MKEKTLMLLHADGGMVAEADLVSWIEYSNPSVYRSSVLRKAHQARLIEYDESRGTAQISPLGIEHVERDLLPRLST
jgi:hypothetical protein